MASKKSKPNDAPAHPTLKNLSEAYIAAIQMDGRSSGTASSYANDLKVAEKYFGEETALRDLTIERVAEYFVCDAVMKKRSGELKNVISIAKTRRILRLALCWAADSGWIDEAPIPPSAKNDAATKDAAAIESPTEPDRDDAPAVADLDDAPIGITIAVEQVDGPAVECNAAATDAEPTLPSFDHPELARDETAAAAQTTVADDESFIAGLMPPKRKGGRKAKTTAATE